MNPAPRIDAGVADWMAANRGQFRENRIVVPGEISVAVIDDDDPFREALADSLHSLGYLAHSYASAREFLATAADTRYGCIVTDIHMPGIDGLDLKRLLAQRGSKVPVIMITARAEPGLEAKVMASGAICLLRKPFGSDALIGSLQKALKA
jgi:FixJ family two-component response regulator